VHCTDATSHATAEAEQVAIRSLSGRGLSSLTILPPTSAPPTGCAVFAVSSSAAVFLEVAGRVDIDAEIEKAKAKLAKANSGVATQRKILDADGFKEGNVNFSVLETEKKKLADVEAEARNYERSIAQFEQLKVKE